MIISDLQHLEIVSEETQIQGQGGYGYYDNQAYSEAKGDSQAYGQNTVAGSKTDTDTFTKPGFSAASSDSKSFAKSNNYPYYR